MKIFRHTLLWLAILAVAVTSAAVLVVAVMSFLVWPVETLAAMTAAIAAVISWLRIQQARDDRDRAEEQLEHPPPAAAGPAVLVPEDPLRAVLGADIYDELNAIG